MNRLSGVVRTVCPFYFWSWFMFNCMCFMSGFNCLKNGFRFNWTLDYRDCSFIGCMACCYRVGCWIAVKMFFSFFLNPLCVKVFLNYCIIGLNPFNRSFKLYAFHFLRNGKNIAYLYTFLLQGIILSLECNQLCSPLIHSF